MYPNGYQNKDVPFPVASLGLTIFPKRTRAVSEQAGNRHVCLLDFYESEWSQAKNWGSRWPRLPIFLYLGWVLNKVLPVRFEDLQTPDLRNLRIFEQVPAQISDPKILDYLVSENTQTPILFRWIRHFASGQAVTSCCFNLRQGLRDSAAPLSLCFLHFRLSLKFVESLSAQTRSVLPFGAPCNVQRQTQYEIAAPMWECLQF
jgi:hypothetical protein